MIGFIRFVVFLKICLLCLPKVITATEIRNDSYVGDANILNVSDSGKLIAAIDDLELALKNGYNISSNDIDCERLISDFENQFMVPSRDDEDIGHLDFLQNHDVVYDSIIFAATPSDDEWTLLTKNMQADINKAKNSQYSNSENFMLYKSMLFFAQKFHLWIGNKEKLFTMSPDPICASNKLSVDRLLKYGGYSAAHIRLLELAENGDADANFKIGVLWNKGLGVPEDIAEAISYFGKAADAGNINAMVNLGSIYTYDERIKTDYPKAYPWFLQAATLSDPQALSALFSMHYMGWIFPPNKSDGIRFALLAENLGWQFDEGFYNFIIQDISPKNYKKLQDQLVSCTLPFDVRCKVSQPLEISTAYLRTSDLEFFKYKKGLLGNSWKRIELETFYNNLLGEEIQDPTLFSKKHTRYFKNKTEPDVCHVYGDQMDLVWYSNSSMPNGKFLPFEKKDYLKFECEEIDLNKLNGIN